MFQNLFELFIGLVCCGIGFLVWAVCGHGIWLLIAALGKALSGTKRHAESNRFCPNCSRLIRFGETQCALCKLPVVSASSSAEREIIVRFLNDLYSRNAITVEQLQEWQNLSSGNALPPIALLEQTTATEQSTPIVNEPLAVETVDEVQYLSDVQAVSRSVEMVTNPAESEIVSATIIDAVLAAEVPLTRALHPLDATETVTQPQRAPAKLSRTLAEMLQSFLDEKNIRWGEILAGLFIVVSAVGLIISLRNTLKAIPYFPALMFMLFTVIFHGAGLYSLRKWNLRAVSKVVLVISLLLVALSFGAGIVLSGSGELRRPLGDPWVIGAIVIALAVFSWVTWTAAVELIYRHAWQLYCVVIGTSVGQIVINRWPMTTQSWPELWGLAALPTLCFLVPVMASLQQYANIKQFNLRKATHLFLLLGIGVFSLGIPIILLFLKVDDRREAIAMLAPLLSLVCGGILGVALLLQHKLKAKSLSLWRVGATSIALLTSLLLFLMLVLAWPRPGMVMAVGLIDAILCFTLAVVLHTSWLHAVGLASLTLVCWIAVPWLRGSLTEFNANDSVAFMKHLTQLPQIIPLAIWNAVVLVAGLCLPRTKLRTLLAQQAQQTQLPRLDRVYIFTAVGIGILVVLLVTQAAFAPWMPPHNYATTASILFLCYTIVCTLAAGKWPFTSLSVAASFLWWLTLVQAICFNPAIADGLNSLHTSFHFSQSPTLLHAITTTLFLCCWQRRMLFCDSLQVQQKTRTRCWRACVSPLVMTAIVASCVALIIMLFSSAASYEQRAIEFGILACTWLLLSWLLRIPLGIVATQLALHVMVGIGICGGWSQTIAERAWSDAAPLFVQQCLGAALLAVGWCGLRLAMHRIKIFRELMIAQQPTLDAILLPILTIGSLVLFAACTAPAVTAEIGWMNVHQVNISSSWALLYKQQASWLFLAALALGAGLSLWERFTLNRLTTALLTTLVLVTLVANRFIAEFAAASALRWLLALWLIVMTLLLLFRESLFRWARRLPQWEHTALTAVELNLLRSLILLVSVVPIVLGTAFTVWAILNHQTLGGPQTGSWFEALGMQKAHGVPLLCAVVALVCLSIRERLSYYMAIAAALIQGVVLLAMLLFIQEQPATQLWYNLALLLQAHAISSGIFSIFWLSADCWIEPQTELRHKIPRLLDSSLNYGMSLVCVLALWCMLAIITSPAALNSGDTQLASVLSYAALALQAIAFAWRYKQHWVEYLAPVAMLLLLCLCAFVAISTDALQNSYPWIGYYFIEASWLTLALLISLGVWLINWKLPASDTATHIHNVCQRLAKRSIFLALGTAGLVAWGHWQDPWHAWYGLSLLVGVQCCLAAQGIYLRTQWLGYLAIGVSILAGVLLWENAPNALSLGDAVALLLAYVGLAMLPIALLWLGIELWWQRFRNTSLDATFWLMPSHRLASYLLVTANVFICMYSWIDLQFFDLFTFHVAELRGILLMFMLLTALPVLGLLWDKNANMLFWAYIWGAATIAFAVRIFVPQTELSALTLCVAMASYVGITAHLWKWGADLATLGLHLKIPEPVAGLVRTSRWLPYVSLAASLLLAIATVVAVLTISTRELRMAAAIIPLLLAWASASFAQQERTQSRLIGMYLFAALAAVCVGWADVSPNSSFLHILLLCIRMLMALCLATLCYALLIPRLLFTFGDWQLAARKAALITSVMAMVVLVNIFVLEFLLFEPGVGVLIPIAQVIAVAIVLIGLVIGLFSIALVPERDPLGMTEAGRMIYVYAAQATIGLLFVHCYVVRPTLFNEMLRPYWPFVIVGIAFASICLSELFKRSGIRVLAEPFERTGGLLPLLPTLGMWFLASQADASLVLFIIGLLYLLHSWMKQSFISSVAALIAGNGALWVWLNRHEDFAFYQHPQFWLIAPAVSTLIAAHFQRQRLAPTALAAIRYAATLVIYLSSTSEMFLVGIGNSLWPPVIVALLGMAGVLAGMLLQIRPFLYMGAGFVLLALMSMVAHAARAIDHVWPWWAFGIGVGIAILVLFGIFEKKREEVTKLIARLRQWD